MPKIEGIALKLAKERLLKQKLTGKPISSATEKLLNKSFSNLKKEGKQFFRYESNTIESMNKGFRPSSSISDIEPIGQYYSLEASDIPTLLSPGFYPRKSSALRKFGPTVLLKDAGVMRAVVTPDAKVVDLSNSEDWLKFLKEAAKDTKYEKAVNKFIKANIKPGDIFDLPVIRGFGDRITRKLKEQGTHVIFPDVAAGQPDIPQLVALEPEKTIAKRKGKYSLMGLAGAAGAISGLMGSDKAEAAPKGLYRLTKDVGKFIAKPTAKAMLGSPERPIGVVFTKGKTALANTIMESEEQGVKYTVKDLLQYAKTTKGDKAGIVKGSYKGNREVLRTTDKDLYNMYDSFIKAEGLEGKPKAERQKRWTEYLKTNYGAVEISNASSYRGSNPADITIVLDPKDVSAKPDLRVLGLGGALGLGTTLYNDKAEASPKERLVSALNKRLAKLSFTPERKALVDRAEEYLREEVVKNPELKKAYLVGSFTSKKPNPSDIDLLVKYKKDAKYGLGGWPENHGIDAHEFNTKDYKEMVSEAKKRYGKDYKALRILGLGGAIGLGSTLYNDKAEAGVKDKMIGAPLKSASKAIKGELSSAWKDLAGTEFKGQTIKYVTKGKGDLRYIILNDDTAYPVSKEVVHSLSKAAGTKKSLGEFSAANAEGKLSKAYKSLKYHMSRAYGDENAITDYSKRYTEQIKLSGLEPPKLSLVEADGKKFTMPKDFADLLNNEGTIKKLKDLP